jgi:hypothetical protein
MRRVIDWLNKRFPVQVVVTVQEYREMREELAQYNRLAQGMGELNIRIVALEAQIGRLNNAQGFVNAKAGAFNLER